MSMTIPRSRSWNHRPPHPWLTTLALLAAMHAGQAAEPATPSPSPAPTPAPAPTATTPAASAQGGSEIDTQVSDALAGNAGALASLRTTALGVEDRKAMAILDRVRASGAGRNSAIAACFVHHREAWVQRTAIITIGKLGVDGRETLDLLVRSIEDPSPIVAQSAAAALSAVHDARSWPALIGLLTSKDPNHVRLALESLQHQTNQTMPADPAAWEGWYQGKAASEEAQFAQFQVMLRDTPQNSIPAIDGMASLVLQRDQATAVLLGLVDHGDPAVRAQAERHLRQWTGTLGGEPLALATDRAQVSAVAPPMPPPASANAALAGTTSGTGTAAMVAPPAPASVSAPAFFESTYGILLIVTVCSAGLATLLWFLRTPAGQLVQNATQRFTKRMGRSRVVVMISNGTKRIARHLPAPVQAITKRITSPAKVMAKRLGDETQRMLKPSAKSK